MLTNVSLRWRGASSSNDNGHRRATDTVACQSSDFGGEENLPRALTSGRHVKLDSDRRVVMLTPHLSPFVFVVSSIITAGKLQQIALYCRRD